MTDRERFERAAAAIGTLALENRRMAELAETMREHMQHDHVILGGVRQESMTAFLNVFNELLDFSRRESEAIGEYFAAHAAVSRETWGR